MKTKILGKTKILLLIAAVVLGYYLLISFADLWLPDDFESKESIAILQAAVTVAAIVIAGFYAIAKWELFRDFEPHLNVSHIVHHRSIGNSYVHLDVTVTLHNSSKVKVDMQKGFLVLQSVAPVTDQDVERVYEEAFAGEFVEDFGWPVLEEEVREWKRGELVIEPGEVHREVLEFIISNEIDTVQVYTYYYNSMSSRKATGWSMGTVYDIMDLR